MKMVLFLSLPLALLSSIGCGKDNSTQTYRVPRETSNPTVPENPARAQFLGVWKGEKDEEGLQTVFHITASGDGTVSISIPGMPTPIWDSVINNVHFSENDLKFDQFMYFTGDGDFRFPGSSTPADHPFSGVKCSWTLSIENDNKAQMLASLTSKDTNEPITDKLTRVEKQSEK